MTRRTALVAACAAVTGTLAPALHAQTGRTTQVALTGDAAPDGDGTLSAFGNPALNNAGQASFSANLAGAGTADTGLFLGGGGPVTQIVRRGQVAPDGNGTLHLVNGYALNDGGQVAFNANVSGASGGNFASEGIFRGSGGTLTQIARRGQVAPDGNGTLDVFLNPTLNDAGQAAFRATLDGTGTPNDMGIFRGSGGTLTQIARVGQAAPDGNGTMSDLSNAFSSSKGPVSFFASFSGATPGASLGLFLGDGINTVQAVRTGNALAGSTVGSINTSSLNVNDFGQVAYRATLADGRQTVQVFTPDLRYRGNVSGSFDTAANWTLSLAPATRTTSSSTPPAASPSPRAPAFATSAASPSAAATASPRSLCRRADASTFRNW